MKRKGSSENFKTIELPTRLYFESLKNEIIESIEKSLKKPKSHKGVTKVEREEFEAQKAAFLKEQDTLRKERDTLRKEQDTFRKERATFCKERDEQKNSQIQPPPQAHKQNSLKQKLTEKFSKGNKFEIIEEIDEDDEDDVCVEDDLPPPPFITPDTQFDELPATLIPQEVEEIDEDSDDISTQLASSVGE